MFKNLVCKSRDAKDKLNKFVNLTKNEVYLITDFDRTITPHFNEKGEKATTWDLLSKKLPEDIRNKEKELYKKYRPLEIAGEMTIKDALDWWSANFEYYKNGKLKWSDLILEVEETIPARPGAIDLFNTCSKKDIPTIIVSAGIKDVIELWCQKFQISPQVILSTSLNFDSDGYICGWDKKSLVHNLNKNIVSKDHIERIRAERPYSILMGDCLNDAAMIEEEDNVLKFFINDSYQKEIKNRQSCDRDTVFEKFDIILEGGDLEPIVELINLLK